MELKDIEGRLREIDMLPTFPGIVNEMVARLEDPKSSASDLARHMDPALAGEVLRIANNAYFGTGSFRNITTIERAIAVIGYEHLGIMILQMPFLTMVPGEDAHFNRSGFIKHALTCGSVCKGLSQALGVTSPSESQVSGITHDVGIIVIYRYFSNELKDIRFLMEEQSLPRTEAEREILGVDHGYIGAALLEMWNIPKTITDGVMYHHDPEKAAENKESALVTYWGNELAKTIDFKEDLATFDDFLRKYRYVTDLSKSFGADLSPSREVEFLEKLYVQLMGVKQYVTGVLEREDDKSSCC